jgi:hypothetical protein
MCSQVLLAHDEAGHFMKRVIRKSLFQWLWDRAYRFSLIPTDEIELLASHDESQMIGKAERESYVDIAWVEASLLSYSVVPCFLIEIESRSGGKQFIVNRKKLECFCSHYKCDGMQVLIDHPDLDFRVEKVRLAHEGFNRFMCSGGKGSDATDYIFKNVFPLYWDEQLVHEVVFRIDKNNGSESARFQLPSWTFLQWLEYLYGKHYMKVLTGGSSKMPIYRRFLNAVSFKGGEPA